MEFVRMAHLGRIISKRSRVRQYQCGEAMRPMRKSLSVRTRCFSASNRLWFPVRIREHAD